MARKSPQCKGYSPYKIISLGQKIQLPITCEKRLLCANATAEVSAIFLLVYFIIDFVLNSQVTGPGSGMCGGLAFVLFSY